MCCLGIITAMEIQKLNFHSLFVRLLAAFTLLGLVPLIFVNQLWYHNTRGIVYQNELDNSANLLNQLNIRLENALNTINVNTYPFLFDSHFQEVLSIAPVSEGVRTHNEAVLKDSLMQIRENNSMISSVSYIGPYYQVCSVDSAVDFERFRCQDWYQHFLEYGKKEFFSPVYINDYIERRGTCVIGWIRRLSIEGGIQPPSSLLVEISHSSIASFLQPAMEGTDNRIFIFDSSGNLIFHPEEEHLFSPSAEDRRLFEALSSGNSSFRFRYEGNPYIVTAARMATTDWYLVIAADTATLLSATRAASHQVTMITVLVLICLVLCAWLISRHITRPVFQLAAAMKQVEDNRLDITLPPLRGYEEISVLSNGFNNMLAHIRRLLSDIRKEEEEKREAELKMLQAQINPHFLYNVLNVIRWRAVMHNEQVISKMVLSLIRLLEFSGQKTDEFVTIEKELGHAKSYVELIQYQYGDKFSVDYQISSSVLPCYTIKFILQPLIENAIFHGLIPMEEVGQLYVSIQPSGDKIHFVICDNGVGMELSGEGHTPAFRGLGLSNVHERLCRYFGKEAGLRIQSRINGGTRIDFEIPLILSNDTGEMKHAQNSDRR